MLTRLSSFKAMFLQDKIPEQKKVEMLHPWTNFGGHLLWLTLLIYHWKGNWDRRLTSSWPQMTTSDREKVLRFGVETVMLLELIETDWCCLSEYLNSCHTAFLNLIT